MKHELDPKIVAVLRCPHCKQELAPTADSSLKCQACDVTFVRNESGALDLRIQKSSVHVELRFDLEPSHRLTEVPWCDDLPANPSPAVDFGNAPAPRRLSGALLSHFPKAAGQDSLMLDLGCGDANHQAVCQQAGFTYVGVDYSNPKAPYWADAHALPFRDESFEFLLSIAVLEHIRFPFVMAREAFRVLKPGGVFIGTVSFLEPFHSNSFYHHSRLGIINTLQYGGFEIVQLAASTNWTVFSAQASMSAKNLFPKMPRIIAKNIILLPQRLSNLWWALGRILKPRNRPVDYTAAAFYFVARKPAS